jgi:hypothetical protein
MMGVPPPFYRGLSEPEIPYDLCKNTLTQLGENQKRPVLISGGAGTPSVKTVESVFDLPFSILRLNSRVSRIDLCFGVCSRESLPEPLSLCVGSLYTLTHPRNLSRESVLYCWLGKTECPIIVEPCYAVASVCHQFWEARVCVSSGLLWSCSA